MLWIFIVGVSAAIIAIAVTVGQKRGKKLMDDGRMIKRDISFVNTAELFTLTTVAFDGLIDTIKTMDFSGTGASAESSREKEAVLFKAKGWTAQLYKVEDSDNKSIYCFSFTNWQTYRGIPQNGVQMNILITEVEKAFLRLDPNTKVETARVKTKTKSNFF